MQVFHEMNITSYLKENLKSIGFTTPTPIQIKAIPLALEGHDVLGSAQTGTGKTAAYGIPLLNQLLESDSGVSLVLLPTRELAVQVMKALHEILGREHDINSALLIGGEDIKRQCKQLKSRPRLIVGTPGRINDHLRRGTVKLQETNFMVLDEVDRMLDMGFGVQLDEIIKHMKAKRQTLMFSATISKAIQRVAAKYLENPKHVAVGANNAPAENIKQSHIKVSDADKYDKLLDELNERKGSIIIFVKTKRSADRLSVKLNKVGHKADALHGDLKQSKRSRVVTSFHKEKIRILVATDVASRGLDIPHIQHVVNYDIPHNPEDYIHRIGRTARAGAEGEAVNFLSSADGMKWKAIQKLLSGGEPEPASKGRGRRDYSNNNKRNPKKRSFGGGHGNSNGNGNGNGGFNKDRKKVRGKKPFTFKFKGAKKKAA